MLHSFIIDPERQQTQGLEEWQFLQFVGNRQKGESQNGFFKSVSGGKKCSFFGKFDVLCFLEKPVLRFVLLPYCRPILNQFVRQ